MPEQLFTPTVSSTPRARSWNLAISIGAHLLFVAAAIIAPIAAGVDNPLVKGALRTFIATDRYLPPAPPAPARVMPAVSRRASVPMRAPSGISAEAPRDELSRETTVGGIEPTSEYGLPGGVGLSDEAGAAPPPPFLPPPPPAPTKPLRIGGSIKGPSRTVYVPPVYPALARAAHVEGIVTLEAIIGIDGRVQNVRVVRSEPLLDQAALDAVRRWRYTPTRLNGIPVPVIMTVVVRFTLQ